jgi:hypothetical protein
MTEAIVRVFYSRLFETFHIENEVLQVWDSCKAYFQQHPEDFITEEGKCLWLIDEIIELYQLTPEEIDEVYWIYQYAKVNAVEAPPNG